MKIVLAVLLFLSPLTALACEFNTDCDVGSKCVKRAGQLEGVCMGGLNPGNNGDESPFKDDRGGTEGKTCSFNTDCDVGERCMKESGAIDGVCMRSR